MVPSQHDTEYLVFSDVSREGRKTKIINIDSARSGDPLGEIRWHGPWRQYTFWPESNTIWNPGCLSSVMEVIAALMAERRLKD